jgi:AraC-like DNA-binding protein
MKLNDYINRQKIEEAKNLLAFSDRSLSEISSYLCFSSQSYFQNLFKKYEGITPLQYRQSARSRLP